METCTTCRKIENLINSPERGNYTKNIEILNTELTLYAGNALIENLEKHLDIQDRYAISHYYKCEKCNRYYHIGICFYGSYKFEEVSADYVETINFEKTFSGTDNIGTYFNK